MDRFKPTLAERERRGELRGPPWPHSSMADPALRRSLPEQPPARTQLQPRVALVVLIGAHFLSAASGATVPAQHHERGRAGCTAERAVLLRNSAAGEQPAMLARSQMCFSGVVPQPLGALGGTRNHCRHPAASTDSPPAQCRRYAQNHAFSPLAPLFPGNMARRTSLQPDSLLGLSMATKQGAGARGRGQEGRGTGAGAGSGGGKEKKPKPKRPNNGVSLSGFLADLPYGLARWETPAKAAREKRRTWVPVKFLGITFRLPKSMVVHYVTAKMVALYLLVSLFFPAIHVLVVPTLLAARTFYVSTDPARSGPAIPPML